MSTRPVKRPSVGDGDDGFPLFAKPAEILHQILDRIEHQHFAPARDHLAVHGGTLDDALRVIAGVVSRLDEILGAHPALLPPVRRKHLLDAADPSCKGEAAGRHFRRHHGDQIVATD